VLRLASGLLALLLGPALAAAAFARTPAATVDGAWLRPSLRAEPEPRHAYALVYDSVRHRAVLFGGISADSTHTFADVWTLDLDHPRAWERLATTGRRPLPRADVLAAYDPRRDRLWVWGGRNHTGAILGDAEFLQFSSVPGEVSTWYVANPDLEPGTGHRPAPRSGAAATWDDTGRMLVFHGGSSGGSTAGGTWALTTDEPPARHYFAAPTPFATGARRANLHVDPVTDRLILHGAVDGEGFWTPEIWMLPMDNSGRWTQVEQAGEDSLVNVPVTSVFDPRGRRLLAMKSGTFRALGTAPATVGLWSFDLESATWTRLAPGGDPGPPDGVRLLHDPAHDRIVALRDQPRRPVETWFLEWDAPRPHRPTADGVTVWRIGPARTTAGGDGIEIPFTLSNATRVTGIVTDPEGRLVRRLDEATLPSGSWTFVWDGRDEGGKSVPPGNYVVALTRLDSGAVGTAAVVRAR
jgi:hypothetical protein